MHNDAYTLTSQSRVDVTTGFAHHPARKWLDIERI